MGIGNLTQDPVHRKVSGDKSLCTFSIAINNGNSPAFFIEVSVWEKLADTCAQFLKKGAKVFVEGSLRTSTWQGKDGTQKSKTSCSGAVVKFLSGKAEAKENNKEEADVALTPEEEAELAEIPF